MRTIALKSMFCCLGVACCAFSPSAFARDDPPASRSRIEASRDDAGTAWRGRRHFLFDDQFQPETVGQSPGGKGCGTDIVRVRRDDGTTTLKRINRCE